MFLFSILIHFPYHGEAEPSKPTAQDAGTGIYKTTWTFVEEDDFQTTDTEVTGGKVSLKINNYFWNLTTKNDFDKGDDELQRNITTSREATIEIIRSDDFEDGTGGWTAWNIRQNNSQWQRGKVEKVPEFIGAHDDSSKYVWGTNIPSKYVESGQPSDYYLKSPKIDLRGSEKTELSFWHYYVFESYNESEHKSNDGGIIEVSIDNGEIWEQIFPKAGYDGTIVDMDNPLYTPPPYSTLCFGGNSSSWIQSRFDISKYDGEENFTFRFRVATNGELGDWGWYIDDIEITSTTFSEGEVTLSMRDLKIGQIQNIIEKNASLTLIDTNNPANVDGILTEWEVQISKITGSSGLGQMKIFRRNANNEFEWRNETDPEKITTIGENSFDCYIPVEAGDYIGWYGENVTMWAEEPGIAYTMPGNVSETHPVSDWTFSNASYAIRATGISLNPKGVLVSQIFDAGSKAMWDRIRWGEDVSPPQTDIIIQTRTANSKFGDEPSWLGWSDPITDSSGFFISSPNGRYFQFMATLTTSEQPLSPTLYNVSVEYRKYLPYGEVETYDFVPDVVVQWLEFSESEISSDQIIDYFFSLDSGSNWNPIPNDGDLSDESVLTGKIRFKMELSTDDTTISPQVNDISLVYSNATPSMTVFLETETKTANPGDTIFINLFYPNNGIGDASDVDITLFLDSNLTYRTATNSPVPPSIEDMGNAIAIRWQLNSILIPANTNRTLTVEVNVRELEEDTKVTCYASLNYSDIGGNSYEGVISNSVTIDVTPGLNILYVLFLVIVATIIIIVVIIFVVKKRREREEAKKISIHSVDKGIGYLVMEDNPTKTYALFSDLIDSGYSGLCMTRTFPGRVKSDYSFEGVSILWLSRAKDPNSILPTNLGAVLRSIKDFMEENESSVILLDGLEYLIVHNEFPRVLKLIHIINEMAAINNSVLLLPLNPLTLDEGKVALLKRDLEVLG